MKHLHRVCPSCSINLLLLRTMNCLMKHLHWMSQLFHYLLLFRTMDCLMKHLHWMSQLFH